MKFLFAVIDDATGTGTAEEMAAIDEFNESHIAHGQLLAAHGVAAPSASILVDNRAGAGLTSTGSLFTGPEFMSGFWIIEAEDAAHAKELALSASKACNRRIELRPIL